jgi:hypothetical protein
MSPRLQALTIAFSETCNLGEDDPRPSLLLLLLLLLEVAVVVVADTLLTLY